METKKQFGVPEVLAALEAAVAKRGADYVYVNEEGVPARGEMNCRYVHHRDTDSATPGCLVGQVYFDLTGSLVPEECEDGTVTSDAMTVTGVFTPEAQRVLGDAQSLQDIGVTWGVALAAAKEKAAWV